MRIDLGIVDGTPYYQMRFGLSVSPRERRDDPRDPIVSDVIRAIKLGMAAQPGARRYQVEIDFPSRWPTKLPPGWRDGGFAYVYDAVDDRICVYAMRDDHGCRATPPIRGNWDAVKSFSWPDLEWVSDAPRPVRSFDLRARRP